MKTELVLVILSTFTSAIYASDNNVTKKIDRNLEIYNKYLEIDKEIRNFVDKNVRKMLPYVLQASEKINISSVCMDNLFQLMSGFRKLNDWSLKFLDATGKPQSGLMSGNIHMFGEEKECFDIVVKNKNKIGFSGQQCFIALNLILPDVDYKNDELKNLTRNASDLMKRLLELLQTFHVVDPRFGICVPSGCTKEDVSQILNYVSEKAYMNATLLYCLKYEELHYWTSEKIVSACIFAFLGLLLIISTILDNVLEEWKKDKLGLFSDLIKCFSITQNFPKLVNINISEDTVSCFYGMRVLTVFWIILCHEYVVQLSTYLSNHITNIEEVIQNFFTQIVVNGFTAVDVFFFLGGFVNCYARVKLHKSGKSQPSIFQIILHRLWRIYPTLIVAFCVFFLLNYSSSPFNDVTSKELDICKKQWWKNFLFINNFYQPRNVCIQHTWYLCADIQIFLLSLFTIPILLRNETLGIYLHIGVIIMANIGSFMLWWILNLPPGIAIFSKGDISHWTNSYVDFQTSIYTLPLQHISPYYIGILFGYIASTKKNKKFSKAVWVLGWLAASFFFSFVIFIPYRWSTGNPYSNIESCLYGAVSKSIVILCVSWMVYCCLSDQARFVNYILSLKIWVPLSRITYMLYMVSITVQFYYNRNLNFPPDFSNISLVWSYFGNLSVATILSLALVLLAESPLLAFEKVLFRRRENGNKSKIEFQKEITLNEVKENGF